MAFGEFGSHTFAWSWRQLLGAPPRTAAAALGRHCAITTQCLVATQVAYDPVGRPGRSSRCFAGALLVRVIPLCDSCCIWSVWRNVADGDSQFSSFHFLIVLHPAHRDLFGGARLARWAAYCASPIGIFRKSH